MTHWKNECPHNKGKGKSWQQGKGSNKGKGFGKNKGFSKGYNNGFGKKGWGKGAYGFEPDYSGQSDWPGSGWGASVPALVLEKGVKKSEEQELQHLVMENTEPLEEKISKEVAAGEWQVPVKTVKPRKAKSEGPKFGRLIPDIISNTLPNSILFKNQLYRNCHCFMTRVFVQPFSIFNFQDLAIPILPSLPLTQFFPKILSRKRPQRQST